MNQKLASALVRELLSRGVEDFCVCAGSRNAPLVAAILGATELRIFNFFDERAAAFFALGRIKATGRPVAVVTTSGTAAAELLPATVEAHYAALPLVLVTADRPRRFRGTGAPQSIEQKNLLGVYADTAVDLEGEAHPEFSWDGRHPLHVNISFDEPLLDGAAENLTLPVQAFTAAPLSVPMPPFENFFAKCRRPVILVGSMPENAHLPVKEFLQARGCPIYVEATSNLRHDESLRRLVIRSGERALAAGHFDGVLRLGGIPHLKFWRTLPSTIPVLSVDHRPFNGSDYGEFVHAELGAWLNALPLPTFTRDEDFFLFDENIYQKKLELFSQWPKSEPALFHALSRLIPDDANIFLGNSLPIREWDLAATFKHKRFTVRAARGANGIDGQLSTFFGTTDEKFAGGNWGIFGDLTTLYDLNAPWILDQLDEVPCTIVVVNNRGGKIFSRLPHLKKITDARRAELFENSHNLEFSSWAKMWNLGYERWDHIPHQVPGASQTVVEIEPDPEATENFWNRYDALWSDV